MRRTKEEAMQTRGDVLVAAAEIIARQGPTAFTLDAVARAAGITKGGVLHHFPSKEALIEGLVESVMDEFMNRLTRELDAEPAGTKGRWLRAYLRTVLAADYSNKNLIPALAAALAADQGILNRIRESYAQSQEAAETDGINPVQATIMRLAIDGIVFSRALKIDVLAPSMGEEVFGALAALSQHDLRLESKPAI